MKISAIAFYFWAASILAGSYDLLESNDRPGTVTGPVWEGDLSQIYAAYQRRDLKTLWNVHHAAFLGSLSPPENAVPLVTIYSNEGIAKVNQIVRDYSGRLLSQIPGHAKYLGDGIDRIAAITDEQRPRDHYFDLLAELGSDQSLHEIGRFWDDPRGRLPPEEEAATIARYQALPVTDVSYGVPGDVKSVARTAMWRARIYYPWFRAGQNGPMPVKTGQDIHGEIDAWWKSPEAAKYHRPIDLTKEPPEEPPPERFDIEALYRQALLEKAQAAKVKVPPPPAPPQVTPDPEETPAADETAEWPLYAIAGIALACLLCLHARQRKRNA